MDPLLAAIPRVKLAQLENEEWNSKVQIDHNAGLVAAKRRKLHLMYILDSFRFPDPKAFKDGDLVVQVTDEGTRGIFVTPPGYVRYVRTNDQSGNTFVYLERTSRHRRKSLNRLTTELRLGPKFKNALMRSGALRNHAYARALLNVWGEGTK